MCVCDVWLLLNGLYAMAQGMKASWFWEPFSKVSFTVILKRQLYLIYTLYVFSVCVIYVIYTVLNALYTTTIELTVENDYTADWSTVFHVFSVYIENCILCVFCMHWALCSLCMCRICGCYSIAPYTMTIELALENDYTADWSTVFYVFSGCTQHCTLCVFCMHWALYFMCCLCMCHICDCYWLNALYTMTTKLTFEDDCRVDIFFENVYRTDFWEWLKIWLLRINIKLSSHFIFSVLHSVPWL